MDNDCNGVIDDGAFADADSDGICNEADNCPDDANADQSDLDEDDLGDVCDLEDTMLTSSGSDVVLDFSEINSSLEVSIIFSQVTGSGYTNVTISSSGPDPASNFEVAGWYYDIETSVVYTGMIGVCLDYDDTGLSSTEEANLALFHWENGAWVDVTTSLDTVNNEVCGQVTSFSAFVVGEYVGGAAGGDGGVGSGSGRGISLGDDDDDDYDHWYKCFIATAAYGTPLAKEVQTLCRFRDTYLMPNSLGRKLVSLYYEVSPPVARYIHDKPYLKAAVRGMLRPVVWSVNNLLTEDAQQGHKSSDKHLQRQ